MWYVNAAICNILVSGSTTNMFPFICRLFIHRGGGKYENFGTEGCQNSTIHQYVAVPWHPSVSISFYLLTTRCITDLNYDLLDIKILQKIKKVQSWTGVKGMRTSWMKLLNWRKKYRNKSVQLTITSIIIIHTLAPLQLCIVAPVSLWIDIGRWYSEHRFTTWFQWTLKGCSKHGCPCKACLDGLNCEILWHNEGI